MSDAARNPPIRNRFEDLIQQLESLRRLVTVQPDETRVNLDRLSPERKASAINLLQYMALRSQDIRSLQDQLAHLGLSSIGRAESNVLATLDAVLNNLKLLSGKDSSKTAADTIYHGFDELINRLAQNTVSLLGAPPAQRRARIMVTMPAAAANDYMMVHQLLKSGMDCMRINCAHDDQDTWGQLISQMRYAERVMQRPCKILMDLRGPKLRTGSMEPAPAVLKIRPVRDEFGNILRPARLWLYSDKSPDCEMGAADACLEVDDDWLETCREGSRIRLTDARGARRNWRIREVSARGCWVESKKTTYIRNGTRLRVKGRELEATISGLPQREGSMVVRQGDAVLVINSDAAGKPAFLDEDGAQLRPGRVSVPIPEIYRDARPGESVCFDDGRISGIIEKRKKNRLRVRITHTRKPEEKLTADKGVNLPDTQLRLPALGQEDIDDLEFVAEHADMIGLSFTNTPGDVRELRKRLRELGREQVGVVVKIETRRGFSNLPGILIEALKFPSCGVMIARGDLAAECGFERMAELQEEILWICESAHVPVIWATQVLDGLTKRGHVSRAEITDAAMGQAAECVMLNKGPYINDAVRTLDDILRRMQDHKTKKRSMLRKLELSGKP